VLGVAGFTVGGGGDGRLEGWEQQFGGV